MPRKCPTEGCGNTAGKARCADCRRRAARIRNTATALRQHLRRMVDRVR